MNITQLIDGGLQYLTKRRTGTIAKKKPSKMQTRTGRCRACGGEVVEVNKITHRRACFRCGKEAK